jgi:hypothetical protein
VRCRAIKKDSSQEADLCVFLGVIFISFMKSSRPA